MPLAFLAKYREAGLLLIRVSLGVLFILYTAPTLIAGHAAWARFGAGIHQIGLHSHYQVWGFFGALAACIGGVLLIFGLAFRIGILLLLALAIIYALSVERSSGFHIALPSIEMCFILAGLLFVGPGKFSVDKN